MFIALGASFEMGNHATGLRLADPPYRARPVSPRGGGFALLVACGVAFGALAGACGDASKRPLGASCGDSGECSSGLCLEGACVDPLKDDDQDGLNNGLEGLLGSNSQLSDSDNDGVADADELTPGQDLVDTDGDGKPDIVESASLDGDGDCITDQFDARDGTVDSDPSPMLSQVCRSAGVCATQEGRLRVSCESGSAQCVYADVEGFADPETACDQRDENCDGQVDEAFPGGCPKDTVRSWLAPATSATTTASSRYRATLTYGPPLGGAAASARHRVVLGRVPASE